MNYLGKYKYPNTNFIVNIFFIEDCEDIEFLKMLCDELKSKFMREYVMVISKNGLFAVSIFSNKEYAEYLAQKIKDNFTGVKYGEVRIGENVVILNEKDFKPSSYPTYNFLL